MRIFRIENEKTMHGMWYRSDGVFDPFIFRLTEGKSKDLPMHWNARYYNEGLKWFSGCNNIEDMRRWFSDRDALELHQNGYKLYQFEADQYVVEEHQTLFTREGVRIKTEIPLDTIWNIYSVR